MNKLSKCSGSIQIMVSNYPKMVDVHPQTFTPFFRPSQESPVSCAAGNLFSVWWRCLELQKTRTSECRAKNCVAIAVAFCCPILKGMAQDCSSRWHISPQKRWWFPHVPSAGSCERCTYQWPHFSRMGSKVIEMASTNKGNHLFLDPQW